MKRLSSVRLNGLTTTSWYINSISDHEAVGAKPAIRKQRICKSIQNKSSNGEPSRSELRSGEYGVGESSHDESEIAYIQNDDEELPNLLRMTQQERKDCYQVDFLTT